MDVSESAAPAGNRSSSVTLVLAAGIATTALALFGNWWLAGRGFDLMGIYIAFILPMGAIAVGLLAGSGYVWLAWLRGERITGVLLLSVLVLQCMAYVQAQYSIYKHDDPRFADGTPVSFPEYFDATTRSIAFEDKNARQPGRPLGGWGYGIRVLEVLGFTGGALIALLGLKSNDYCETCERYMKKRSLVTLPASAPFKNIPPSDQTGTAAQQSAQTEAEERLEAMLRAVIAGAEENDATPLKELSATWKPQGRKTFKLPVRVMLSLTHCPGCATGYLTADACSGQGEGVRARRMWKLAVAAPFVEGVLAKET